MEDNPMICNIATNEIERLKIMVNKCDYKESSAIPLIHRYFEETSESSILKAETKVAPSIVKEIKNHEEFIELRFKKENNNLTLVEALEKRHSERAYLSRNVSFEDLSYIIHYSYGIKKFLSYAYNVKNYPVRYSPSAGGLQPFDLYLFVNNVDGLKQGTYYYHPLKNGIYLIDSGNKRIILRRILKVYFPVFASVIFVIVANINRVTWKYGERAYRFLNLDAGILAENICLLSTSVSLGSCMLAAYDNKAIKEELDLTEHEEPMLLISIGKTI
ncbi:SagB/ThcOx family dehydrogenase [Caldisericum exile]|uniref:Oxidoreductase n=1 Tax=Caldisericum exile (strain DSM 21853 / NBRC 104410 / AZM16c01) TaxID=511051 RepID=A0A7U6JFB1_CALEA|nr:SagB/ThcOx family dehydrogenase [Caldisericum exile]BAL80239.1 putative oxidoreductase [Caldisericum exile AZM16c01]